MAPRRKNGALATIARHLTSGGDGVAYEDYITDVSAAREPNALRELYPLLKIPGMLSLGNGQPNPSCFPFEEMEVKFNGGITVKLEGKEMAAAVQYDDTVGTALLREWIGMYMEDEHAPPTIAAGRDFMVTIGSQDALAKAVEMLCGPEGTILTESPSYPGAIGPIRSCGTSIIGVEIDEHGITPGSLQTAIAGAAASGQPTPKVLYLIPHGQNPSGSSMPLWRKKEVYQACREHSLLLIEDDPYHHLQLEGDAAEFGSFYQLDVDGRVLRLDSFSKVLGGGLRLGWVSGPTPLVERMRLHQQSTTMQASTLSMTLAARLLTEWGLDGYRQHIEKVQAFYRSRRDVMAAAAAKHLSGLALWKPPVAGMFFWFDLAPSGVVDSSPLILEKCRDKKVLLAPGQAFSVATDGTPSRFARASFSVAEPEAIEEAFSRLAQVLEEFKLEQTQAAAVAVSAAATAEAER